MLCVDVIRFVWFYFELMQRSSSILSGGSIKNLRIPQAENYGHSFDRMTLACATSNGKVVVHDLPLDLTVLCIAAVVCGRLNSIVKRHYTVGSRQAVQHCGRGR